MKLLILTNRVILLRAAEDFEENSRIIIDLVEICLCAIVMGVGLTDFGKQLRKHGQPNLLRTEITFYFREKHFSNVGKVCTGAHCDKHVIWNIRIFSDPYPKQ